MKIEWIDAIIFWIGAAFVGVISYKFGSMLGYGITTYQFWVVDALTMSIYILGSILVYAFIQIDWNIDFDEKEGY